MFRTIQSRLWLTYTLLMGLVMGVALFAAFLLIRNIPIRLTQVSLQRTVTAILRNERLEAAINAPQPALNTLLRRVDQDIDIRLLLIDKNGMVIGDSENIAPPARRIPANKLRRAQLEEEPITGVFRDTAGRTWQYVISSIGPERYLVAAALQPKMDYRTIFQNNLLTPFARAGLIALFLTVVLAILTSRWVAKPLNQIAQAAWNIANGNFTPILGKGPEEVQDLAAAFNEMSSQVQTSQESQRDFVANVSHELKTPLTSIRGYSQAILDGTIHEGQDIENAANIIYTEANRMNRLVTDLLDLARLDAGPDAFQIGPVDLNALLDLVVEKFLIQAQNKKITLNAQIDPLPELAGDGDRLNQVFTNLIDNAVKHTPAGSRIQVNAVHKPGMIMISVANTGDTIPPEDKHRIFERFYQLDKARPGGGEHGAGLGLAIAKEIIHAHGGTIELANNLGQQTVFVVKLPLILPS